MTQQPVHAHDRSGPRDGTTLLLLHAGVADRRMWDPVWDRLTAARDVVRLDLRGFGESTTPPTEGWSHATDVLDTLDAIGLERVHVVGASMGAGVAVETTLLRPAVVASLVLLAPGGSLIPDWTDDLRTFADAENAALDRGDLDAAAQANVDHWLVGPGRSADAVPEEARRLVHAMQRRAFEIEQAWPEVEEGQLDPPALERLSEVSVRTLVLQGGHDLTAIKAAADVVVAGIPGAVRIDWPDVAHLPSMERPDDVATLVEDWIAHPS